MNKPRYRWAPYRRPRKAPRRNGMIAGRWVFVQGSGALAPARPSSMILYPTTWRSGAR